MSSRHPPRRMALISKQVSNFYKGNRVGSMGRFVRRGGKDYSGFRIDDAKVRTFVPPPTWVPRSLPGKQFSILTPFVPENYKPVPPARDGSMTDREIRESSKYWKYRKSGGPSSGQFYLDQWKAENGRS